jgi:uncharacterized protein (DUF2236 family)
LTELEPAAPTLEPMASTTEPAAPDGEIGLFGPGSVAWSLDREAWLLLGAGPRALLLQLAHPLVAEGVAQHSEFRADPWRRLAGTLRSYLAIVYGSTARARAELRRLNRLHVPIRGPVRDAGARARFGEAYDARDPVLRLWVHATLVESTLAVTDAWAGGVDRARRARFHDEMRPVGRALGIPDRALPPDLEAFERYWASMLAPGGPIGVSGTARSLAPAVLRPPLAPAIRGAGPAAGLARAVGARVPAAAHAWLLWPAIGLLPDRVRAGYGLAWGPGERLVSAWLVAGWRGWAGALPRAFREMPLARAADRRVAARRGPAARSRPEPGSRLSRSG